MAATKNRLPIYAVASAAEAERYAIGTQNGHYALSVAEKFWRDRYTYLRGAGYVLRPRYNPSWSPSWIGTNLVPTFCEDSILLIASILHDHSIARANLYISITM